MLSEHTTKSLSIFASIVIKSVDSTFIMAPDAFVAFAIAAAAAAAPPAAAPFVILDSLSINSRLLELYTSKRKPFVKKIRAIRLICNYNKTMEYKFTNYFEKEVLCKRPYLKKEWCIRVIKNPIRVEPQEHNRFRFWGVIEELGNLTLRVITLEDKVTIHNAFPDRRFKL